MGYYDNMYGEFDQWQRERARRRVLGKKEPDQPATTTLMAMEVTGTIRAAAYEAANGQLVVPVIALVPGVLRAISAPEPEFVPPTVLGCQLESWGGRPVTNGHPRKDGKVCSANADPEIHARHTIGTVYNPRVVDEKLLMEAWIDPLKAQRIAPELLHHLRAGKPHDVSIGVFAAVRKQTGKHQGQDYSAVWERIAPDHLAFVPRGACSAADGCGANRAAQAIDLSVYDPPDSYADAVVAFRAATAAREQRRLRNVRKGLHR
jgi:hypothetical protein